MSTNKVAIGKGDGCGKEHPWVSALGRQSWQRVRSFLTDVDLHVCIAVWTPDVCRRVLSEFNTRNRRRSASQVQTLVEIMKEGRFELTGESIIFDSDGVLLNGQHRLQACVDSGCDFESLVVAGVDPAVFRVLDQHSRRAAWQVLGMDGTVYDMPPVRQPRIVAACLVGVIGFFIDGRLRVRQRAGGKKSVYAIDSVIDYWKRFTDLDDSAEFIAGFKLNEKGYNAMRRLRGRNVASLCHWAFSRVDSDLANQMFADFLTGTMDKSPRWESLRNLHDRLEANLDRGNAGLPPGHTEQFLVDCWNALRTGKRVRVYRAKTTFPRIDGWDYEDTGVPKPFKATGEEIVKHVGSTEHVAGA